MLSVFLVIWIISILILCKFGFPRIFGLITGYASRAVTTTASLKSSLAKLNTQRQLQVSLQLKIGFSCACSIVVLVEEDGLRSCDGTNGKDEVL